MNVNRADFYRDVENDSEPDLSYLGEYSDRPETVHIDRAERGGRGRNEYRYFNLGCGDANYIESDYARYEKYNRGDWHMMGIRAAIDLEIPTGRGGTISQTITSPGVWGIESDSDASFLDEVFQDECRQLEDMLQAMGLTVTDSDDDDSEGGEDAV